VIIKCCGRCTGTNIKDMKNVDLLIVFLLMVRRYQNLNCITVLIAKVGVAKKRFII